MARIVMADDGIEFDGVAMRERALGGAESAFVCLAEALARRGHQVSVRNNCAHPGLHWGVEWAPLERGFPASADLYIANRGDRLILKMARNAKLSAFWLHNPARYLLKLRYLWKLAFQRPALVFAGPAHMATYPAWAPGGKRVAIPLGVDELFLKARPAPSPPPPRAIFTSNPQRGLAWLLELWAARIHPALPAAELHVFSGPSVYGGFGAARAAAMQAVLDRARALRDRNVILREPVARVQLVEELRRSRAMLYRGDPGESFCLAVAEAQAMGVPAVVQRIGAVPERVIDGETGFVAVGDGDFALHAIRLLSDDALWLKQHQAAIARQRGWGWPEAAARFEALIP
jgi:glycosyltransferase involved in cell wall biosynthesis